MTRFKILAFIALLALSTAFGAWADEAEDKRLAAEEFMQAINVNAMVDRMLPGFIEKVYQAQYSDLPEESKAVGRILVEELELSALKHRPEIVALLRAFFENKFTGEDLRYMVEFFSVKNPSEEEVSAFGRSPAWQKFQLVKGDMRHLMGAEMKALADKIAQEAIPRVKARLKDEQLDTSKLN